MVRETVYDLGHAIRVIAVTGVSLEATARRSMKVVRGRVGVGRGLHSTPIRSPMGRPFRVLSCPLRSPPDHKIKPRSQWRPQAGHCVTTTSVGDAIRSGYGYEAAAPSA